MARHFESVYYTSPSTRSRRERERETHSLGFLLMAVYFVHAARASIGRADLTYLPPLNPALNVTKFPFLFF